MTKAHCSLDINLIDWISDTLSQEYTNLQSLQACTIVKVPGSYKYCVRYNMQSSEGCVRLRDALKCIGMHLGGYHYSHVEMSLIVVGSC